MNFPRYEDTLPARVRAQSDYDKYRHNSWESFLIPLLIGVLLGAALVMKIADANVQAVRADLKKEVGR
jgi:hypothetical protein